MKICIILIAVAIYSNAFGQQHIVTYYDAFNKHKQEVYDLDSKGEKNGKYISYFVDGRIEAERNYIHGKLNGKETIYYTDGYRYGLAHVYNYKNDEQDGLQQDYIVSEQGEMNNLGFHKLPAKEHFLGKTNADSWIKEYSETGNGKRYLSKLIKNGVEKGYRTDGHQWYQKTDNGRNFQEATAFGNKLEFETVDGKKNGLYREWYQNGTLGDSCYYKDDVVDGIEMQIKNNGDTLMSFYIEGTLFDPVDSSKTVRDSMGHFSMYNENGVLMIQGTLVNGKLNGDYKVYQKGNRIFRHYIYKDGEIIERKIHLSIND